MAVTSLFLFGKLELSDRDGTSVPLQAKRAAVLAYLAVARPGPWHRRDSILALFWPESDEAHGRSALSKAVYYLRDRGGSGLVLGRGDQELGLPASDFWCDVSAFEEAIRRGALEEAAALYKGPLLEGFHLPGAPDFSHWLDTERSRLHRCALDAAWGLVDRGESRGSHAEATKWARQALLWSPTDETGLRRLLALLHDQGKRTDAIKAYDSFQTTCREQYGIEPSDETTALIDAIRDGSRPTRSSIPHAGRVSRLPDEALPEVAGASPGAPGEPNPEDDTAKRPRWTHAIRGRSGWVGLPVVALVTVLAIATSRNQTTDPGTALGTSGEKQRIVLADFHDRTGENLGNVVTRALRVDLLEASNIILSEAADIAPILRLMQVERGAPLTAELAREVALREGIGAVFDGDVASAGAGYLLTGTLRDAQTGRSLASFRVTAAGPDDFVGAIDQLSEDLRRRSGESLLAIRAGQPLERATTPSLEALKLYSEAVTAFDANDPGGSTRLLELALAKDSTFAMAWRMLGILGGGREATAKAFQYRDRLSDVERYLVEGHFFGGGDFMAAKEAYENVLRINPDEPRALNNLAALLRGHSELAPALALFRRAQAGPGRSSWAQRNLIGTLIFADSLDEAVVELQRFEDTYPEQGPLVGLYFALAFAQGDLASAAEYAGQRFDDVNQLNDALNAENQGRLARWGGRLSEARSLYLRAEALRAGEGRDAMSLSRVTTAYEEALAGDVGWARFHVSEEPFAPATLRSRIMTLVYTDGAEAADVLIREWEELFRERGPEFSNRNGIKRVSLYSRVERGDTVGAMETMQGLLREVGCSDACWPFARARLYDGLNAYEEAIDLYERVLLPGYSYGADSDDVNVGERLYAMLRLGPLYEELGETEKAIEAYRRMVDQWADGDARGLETVTRFRERIRVLAG